MIRKFGVLSLLLMLVTIAGHAQEEKVNQKDAQGRMHGKWVKMWPKSNSPQLVGQYKNGVPYGEFKGYYFTGELATLQVYSDNGKVKRVKMYHENGYIMAKGKYVSEQRDSVWQFFETRGRLNSMETYVKGKKHGPSETYYTSDLTMPNGAIQYVPNLPSHQFNYKNGLLDGPFKELYTTGKPKVEGTYKDGNLEGKVTRYTMGGMKEVELHYKHAVLNGWSLYYNDLGQVETKVYYLNGKKLEGKALEAHLEKLKQEQLNKK